MMKMIVTFEASSAEELRTQMMAFLALPAEKSFKETLLDKIAEAKSNVVVAKKKAKAPPLAPEPQAEPQEEPAVEGLEADGPEPQEAPVTPAAENAVALLKLKEVQLNRLRGLFNAGKGPLVRQLLAKYGEGAKVFPEVDAKHFPQIKVELDRELGVQ